MLFQEDMTCQKKYAKYVIKYANYAKYVIIKNIQGLYLA